MCILCVVQRWARRVASMLPYLVIPLILLWALSHFLPPSFRFEATSPRIACAVVLLLSLAWYEFLLPRLSIWREQRSARLRERRREQALELQKLRKTATRRCRNCLAPYRDQNPGVGGKFMCSNCGHVSKRPVLELPGHASNFVEKNGWLCNQFLHSESNNGFWLDDRCNSQDCSGLYSIGCKIGRVLSCFLFMLKWICRKVFRFGFVSSSEGRSGDSDQKRASRRGENGVGLQESRSEKSRRRAEEKRLARLEKEMLEEEERKQREEVARLVEERRRLRDEKLEAEEKSKGATPVGERESKKELDRKRQERERRREKDKGSNKSNSDVEDLDKRGSSSSNRESEKKRDFDKKGENFNNKSHYYDSNNNKTTQQNKQRYFGNMAGNLGTRMGFSGASFFGRSAQNSPVKANKSGFTNQTYAIKRDIQTVQASTSTGVQKATSNGDDRSSETKIARPVNFDSPPVAPAPKKAWHQLFKRSTPVSPSPDLKASNFNNQNGHLETQISNSNSFFNTQTSLNPSLPFPVYSSPFAGMGGLSYLTDGMLFPPVKDPMPAHPVLEEPELFEDPCYDPDAIALLGPVSESLDNLPLDLGTGFLSRESAKIHKPSPIESPLSRSRVSEERKNPFDPVQKSYASVLQDSVSGNNSNSNAINNANNFSNEQGTTWQLWGAPLAQNALGSVGGSGGAHSSGLFMPTTDIAGEIHSPRHAPSVSLNPSVNLPGDPVVKRAPFQPWPADGESLCLPHNIMGNFVGTTNGAANPAELSPINHWSKKEWMMNGANEAGNSNPASPNAGSLFSTDPVVQSVWSFNNNNQKD